VTLNPGDSYVCANCGGEFVTEWASEQADAEYAATFPAERASRVDEATICHECYIEFMAWWKGKRDAQPA
jgi:hypothetical protein